MPDTGSDKPDADSGMADTDSGEQAQTVRHGTGTAVRHPSERVSAMLRIRCPPWSGTRIVPRPVPQVDQSEGARLIREFQSYLMKERGMTSRTSFNRYVKIARLFVVERFGAGPLLLKKLQAKDVTDFLLRHTSGMNRKTAQLAASILRCFLRFLHLSGYVGGDLALAVPPVSSWSLAGLPKFVPQEDVKRILASCDQSTAAGRRDYAILLLFARLGLRAAEVVNMRLEDVDWGSGEICIRGKGGRWDRLPLPQDVGEALAGYVKDVRPRCPSRHLFIRMQAPFRGLKNSSATYSLVRTAFERAGVEAVEKGPHILRHSLATQMLHHGASLAEIGEILRHTSQETTRIYAKVDVNGLREVALAWPGGSK